MTRHDFNGSGSSEAASEKARLYEGSTAHAWLNQDIPAKTASYHVLGAYLPTVHEARGIGQPQKSPSALCGCHVVLEDMGLPDWANTLRWRGSETSFEARGSGDQPHLIVRPTKPRSLSSKPKSDTLTL